MWNHLLNQLQDRIDGAVEMLQEDDYAQDGEYEEEYCDEEGVAESAATEDNEFVKLPQPTNSPCTLAEAATAAAGQVPGADANPLEALLQRKEDVRALSTPPAVPAFPAAAEKKSGEWSSALDVALNAATDGVPAPPAHSMPTTEDGKTAPAITPQQIDAHLSAQGPEAAATASTLSILTRPPAAGDQAQEGPPMRHSPLVVEAKLSHCGGGAPLNAESEQLAGAHGDSMHSANRPPVKPADPVQSLAPPAADATRPCAVGTSEAHAQLLRFQQQLADEMSSNVALTEANTRLASQLAEAESALAEARKTIAASPGTGESVSTLIEKLGRETERGKHVIEERNKLRNDVAELGGLVEEYRVKEAAWFSSRSAQAESQSSAQVHIAQLEAEVQKCTTRVEELEIRLAETERARALLSSQLQESCKQHESAVVQLKEVSSESLELAEREVERLRAALRRGSAEHDERIVGLEHELREATTRAHQAEERLSDLERGSVSSLSDLRSELEDMQARVSLLTSELNSVRNENNKLLERYSSLKRAHASEEAMYKEKLAAQTSIASAIMDERASLAEALTSSKAQAQAAEAELSELRRRCMMLEAAGGSQNRGAASPFAQPTSSPQVPVHGMGTGAPPVNTFSNGSPFRPGNDGASQKGSQPASPSSSAASTTLSRGAGPGGSAIRPPPLFTPSPAFGFGGTGGEELFTPSGGTSTGIDLFSKAGAGGPLSRSRLEREMVRQAVEIERLRQTEAEAFSLKAKLRELEAQHDLMLQMYGQMEEDLKEAKRNAQQR